MPIDCRSSKSRNGASRESTAVVNSTELGLLNNVLKDLSVVHFFSFVDDSVFVDLQFEYLQSGSLCHITVLMGLNTAINCLDEFSDGSAGADLGRGALMMTRRLCVITPAKMIALGWPAGSAMKCSSLSDPVLT